MRELLDRLTPRSLTGRVALAAAGAASLAFLVAGIAVLIASGRSDRNALDNDLRSTVDRLAGPQSPGRPPIGGGFAPPGFGFRRGLRPLDPGIDRFARVTDTSGNVLVEAGATVPAAFPAPNPDGQLRTVHAGGERWRVVAVPEPPFGALQIAARLEPLDSRARRLRLVVALAFIVASAGAAMLAQTLSRVALAPLARLRDGAVRVRETQDLSDRIDAGGEVAETDELAGELNAMLARLEQTATERERALQSAQRFAADAGHELRTPLTSLTASLATLARNDPDAAADALRRAEGDLARLTNLVGQLQSLARGDAGLSASAENVDLGETADAAIAGLKLRHPGVEVTLVAPNEGPFVRGDPDGLRGILDNLLENAAVHGRADGRVTVRLSPEAELIVDDDGPGIPEDEREAVLERFTRGAATTAPGSGLGLSIVAAQALRHSGRVELGESPTRGLRVRVVFG